MKNHFNVKSVWGQILRKVSPRQTQKISLLETKLIEAFHEYYAPQLRKSARIGHGHYITATNIQVACSAMRYRCIRHTLNQNTNSLSMGKNSSLLENTPAWKQQSNSTNWTNTELWAQQELSKANTYRAVWLHSTLLFVSFTTATQSLPGNIFLSSLQHQTKPVRISTYTLCTYHVQVTARAPNFLYSCTPNHSGFQK